MMPTPHHDHVLRLDCIVCGKEYDPAEVDYTCSDHGAVGTLDVVYDYELAASRMLAESRRFSMWRYLPLLPVARDADLPRLRVGWTQLVRADRLAADLGVEQLWIKDEGRQPTGSLKDRASALAVVKARERGAEVVTTASTGNAAAALAGICADMGQRCVIFVPASAPEAKVAQLLAYGAEVRLVDGSYDQAFDLCTAVAAEEGWYDRSTGVNPYMTEGKKTVLLEVIDQLGRQAPDVVVTSVGDGCIIGSLHKAIRDLLALDHIDRAPRLIGVQAEGSSYLVQAWERGEDVLTKPPAPADTVADSISAGLPRDRIKAMSAVRETGGAFLAVSDDDILAAIPELAAATGIFAEPAAAAGYAGLKAAAARGLVEPADRVVLLSTGSGLKDVPAAMRAVAVAGREPQRVSPRN